MFFLVTSLAAALGLWDVSLRIDMHRARAREAVADQDIQELEETLLRLRSERHRAEADPELWRHIESLGFKRELKPSRQLAKELKEGKPGVQADNGADPARRPW